MKFSFKENDKLQIVDYLDIQDATTDKLLLMSREGLTAEGKKYIQLVYNDILKLTTQAYWDISLNLKEDLRNIKDIDENELCAFFAEKEFLPDNFVNKLMPRGTQKKKREIAGTHNVVIESLSTYKSVFMLSILAYHASLSFKSCSRESKKCLWDYLLLALSNSCKVKKMAPYELPYHSNLHSAAKASAQIGIKEC